MRTPQEVEVWYVIPALRRELTKKLRLLGLKQKTIAERLGLKEATVSQYVKNKRAKDIIFPKDIEKKIGEAAEKIAKEETCPMKELICLCRDSKKICCDIHKKIDNIKCNCNICLGEQD